VTRRATPDKGPKREENQPLADTSFVVPDADDGVALDRALRSALGGKSWNEVRRLIETGKVRVDDEPELDGSARLRRGARVELKMNAPRPSSRSALDPSSLVYVDRELVVVRKPPGISTVPYDANETGTLDELVRRALWKKSGPEAPLGIVHRLDKETSGLLVFARTLSAKLALKQQFRFHTVKRRYVAIAHGKLGDRTFRSRLVQDRGDGLRGSTDNPKLGREATTHVRALERLEGATLVECRLETGRTHQIRIHLSESGFPLVGERVYVKGFRGQLLDAPRLMLHARELGFEHPTSRRPLHFEEPPPRDFEEVLRRLRRTA
jgi:23S rRNA pseudouridine1911/1915/1917 synthase